MTSIPVIKVINLDHMDFNCATSSFCRESINIKEYYEVEYWANQFGVKPAQLKEAVQAVGPAVRDVESALSQVQRSNPSV